MAEQETLAQVDAEKTENAESAIADFLFGEEPKEEAQEEEFEYEAGQEPVPEGEEAEPEEAEETPEFVEVEYDGKLYEVPTELKDALLRQSDYTQKTQEVASQRGSVEVQLGELEAKRAEFEFAESVQADVLKAQQLEETANQYHEYLRSNIDDLSSTDIEKLRLAIDDARRERDSIVESVKGKQTEFQQAQEQSYQELLNKGTEVLKQKIPNWGEESQKQLREYALSTGFTEAEISQLVDPRQVEALWKASQYDALKAGATPAVKKVQEAPSIKPKARDGKGRFVAQKQKLQKALKSNMPDNQKANLIGDDIASRFFS